MLFFPVVSFGVLPATAGVTAGVFNFADAVAEVLLATELSRAGVLFAFVALGGRAPESVLGDLGGRPLALGVEPPVVGVRGDALSGVDTVAFLETGVPGLVGAVTGE
jgi:hypothetical protein